MKKTMMKHFAQCAAFLIGLALLLEGVSYLYRPRDNTHKGGMDEPEAHGYLSEPAESIDVFFVGSSEFYSDVSPMKIWEDYGITSYDMATSSQRLRYTNCYVHELFQTHRPKIVAIDGYVAVQACDPDKCLYSEGVFHFPVIELHENWKRFDWNTLCAPVRYTDHRLTKGYWPSGYTVKVSYEGFMEPTDETEKLPLLNRCYLDRIRRMCQANGAQMVLITMPSPKNWNDLNHRILQEYAQEAGVPFVDLNLMVDELDIDPETDYRDEGDHLNRFGAHKASAYLGRYFKENFGLDDHRQNQAYAQWNEDLKEYLALLEEKYAVSYPD